MESIISAIYTICGILYTALAGKGRVVCYTFGIIATCCYSYLAYNNHVYGNLLLNLGYYLPMQVLGIFEWKKHLKKDKNEIIKTRLSKGVNVFIITGLLLFAIIGVLKLSNDKAPFLDGITTTFSILGMYLTVKRCIEQWIIWIIVDLLAIIMWIKLSLTNHSTYSTIIVWSVYLALGVYFYFQWRKEVYEKPLS